MEISMLIKYDHIRKLTLAIFGVTKTLICKKNTAKQLNFIETSKICTYICTKRLSKLTIEDFE